MLRAGFGRSLASMRLLGQIQNLNVPFMGDSVSNVKLALKCKVGDMFLEDEMLAEVEGDKTNQPINAPFDGKVVNIVAENGTDLDIGAHVLDFEECEVEPRDEEEEAPPAPAASPAAPAAPAARASPAAAPAASRASPAAASDGERTSRVPMTNMRKTIQSRMVAAKQTTAMLTTFQEIDMSGIMDMRKAYKQEFEEAHGVRLGLMSPFVKACATALQEYPIINASMEGEEIVYHSTSDIGVAVATPAGLVVPIVRRCESMSFADIEGAIADYAAKAKKNQVSVADMTGGTFTISNGGTFGSLFGTPILNLPQSALLGMHSIYQRVVPGPNDEPIVRPVMVVALTYDHRLIDDRDATLFLIRVKQMIEDPVRFMLQ